MGGDRTALSLCWTNNELISGRVAKKNREKVLKGPKFIANESPLNKQGYLAMTIYKL